MANSTTRLPNRGDIVARTLGTNNNVYFKQSDFVLASLTPNTYEILGVVAWRFRDMVLVTFKKNVSKKWLARWQWTLTGYTLDGAEHSGILVLTTTAAGDATAEHTITYTASDRAALVTALNTYFASLTAAGYVAQDFYAFESGETIQIQCECSSYNQYTKMSAKSGFGLTGNHAPTETYLANMRRKNGGTGAYGASGSFARYVAYYGSKAAETLTAQSPIKTTGYPIAKATYIANANGYCDTLIARYGSGEAGWLKYMKSCKPVRETDYGNHGMHDGDVRGQRMGTAKYSSSTKTNAPLFPASEYCYNLPTYESLTTVTTGEFWLPTTQQLDYIVQDVLYGTSGSRDADPLNAGLNKINGTAVSNGAYWWSCCRDNAYYAWFVFGYYGYFDDLGLSYSSSVLPVSLFTLK